MTYVPDVTVELAFGAGYSTPAASRTWTDVSDYVEADQGINIGFGRGDELSTADANTLSLTLDNTDGRFTAGLATGTYYPDVKIGVPIRVTATPVGGAPSVRFVGYVEEWPVEWDGAEDYAKTTITATSRMARMGLSSQLRLLVREYALRNAPYLYYPLDESADATVVTDVSGNAHNATVSPLGTTRTVGAGLTVDDPSAPVFAAGGTVIEHSAGSAITTDQLTISCFIKTTSVSTQSIASVYERPLPATNVAVAVTIGTNFSGELTSLLTLHNGGTTLTDGLASTSLVNDGEVHHVMVSLDIGGSARLFVDGVQEDTSSVGGGLTFAPTAVVIGAGANDLYVAPTATFVGALSNLAVFTTALVSADAADIAETGLTGYVGDTTDVRAAHYLDWEGVPTGEQDLEAGTVTMAHIDTSGSTVLDLLRIVEATEDGTLFDAPDGKLTLHSRLHRYGAPAAFTFDVAAGRVESDYQPKLDRSTLVNTATASNLAGTVEAVYSNTDSIESYGVAETSLSTAAESADEPLAQAYWRVNQYAEPRVRVPSLSVDLLPFNQVDQNKILALTIGDRISVTNHPAQAAESTADYFVEGYAETITSDSYTYTFNSSPGWPFTSLFTVGDATLGAIGGPGVLAH